MPPKPAARKSTADSHSIERKTVAKVDCVGIVPLLMPDTSKPDTVPTRRRISGTAAMIVGTAVSAISAYGYQVIAGRSLGTEGLAPIGVLWTVSFLVFTVLFIPVEQYVTRRLTIGGHHVDATRRDTALVVVTAIGGVVAGALFTAVTIDVFFQGSSAYVIIMIGILSARAVMAVARGFLAGARRFRAYGLGVALEGLTIVGSAAVISAVSPSTLAFSAALAWSPLAVLVVLPFKKPDKIEVAPGTLEQGAGFLGALIVGTAASQMILASGPIVVGLVGGTAAAISIFFITFTLFRGPVTSSYNIVALVLPDFTLLAARGEQHRLSEWAGRLGLIGAGTVPIFGLSGYLLGPLIIQVLYGSEFMPSRLLAGLGAAGVGAALIALFLNQIYVARGETGRLAVIWIVALAAAGVSLLVFPWEPMIRVGTAFAVGEVTALTLLTLVGVATHWSER
jgi:O-antigen/teichoic acid export membrane protein